MASFNLRTYGANWGAQFTEESASAALTYFLEADADDEQEPNLEELRDKIKELTGWTETAVGLGNVKRHLPMAHPIYTKLVVSNVQVEPVGDWPTFGTQTSDPDEILEAVPLPVAVTWGAWKFEVSFAPRVYPMVSDDLMIRVDSQWRDESGDLVSFSYYPEWNRYTTWQLTPRDEFVKARHGEVLFRTGSGASPNGVPYPAFPNIPLPDDVLTVTWHRVPYRFVRSASSFLRLYRNYVNQFAWQGYAPGAVLYRGFKDRRVNPPFPELDEDWGGAGIFAVDPLVDVDLEFWVTRRVAVDPPVPSNPNWITEQGWNCFPNYYKQAFYYASNDNPDVGLQAPFFKSFPVEKLFVDPDAGI